MPTKLIVLGKPYKGTPVGGTVTVTDSHVKTLVTLGRLGYQTRMLQAEPIAAAPEPVQVAAGPVKRGPGRPRKVQVDMVPPTLADEQAAPIVDELPTETE